MDDVEDNWVREFDVSNPQKTHAGYTVYRIISKLYPKGSPEAASEVIVFKRYSEIRKLHKDLKQLYESKYGNKKFPHFTKANFFSRFDDAVIEQRQRQALQLLTFAGNSFLLFTSQPFLRFFEDGVQPRGSSMASDDSSLQLALEEGEEVSNVDLEPWTPQSYFATSSSDEETSKDLPDDGTPPDDDSTPVANRAWLARAMTLCSEGDDIEILASEAGFTEQGRNDGTSPGGEDQGDGSLQYSSQPSESSVDMLPTLLESSDDEQDNEDVFDDTNSLKSDSNKNLDDLTTEGGTEHLGYDINNEQTESPQEITHEHINPTGSSSTPGEDSGTSANSSPPTVTKKEAVDRRVSNIGVSWIDPKKKDYLYEAAQVIQEALYCEANEFYEEAFSKYKMCVAILLKGVQHDSNSKRREAVRRKTAQYLVKAEFLFNTYLKEDKEKTKNDWTVKLSSNTSGDIHVQNVVERRFAHLTLRDLKVIGVIKKVMLAQCENVEGVFVVKVLHKTNAVHRSVKQVENKHNNKGYARKYINSSRMVKLYRHFDSNNSIFLLLQYASGGELWSHVGCIREHTTSDGASGNWTTDAANVEHGKSEREFERVSDLDDLSHDASAVGSEHVIRERSMRRWIAELLLAIVGVHSCGIILKDLKPTNVLLDEYGHVKLTYFGVWEEVDHSVDLEAVERLYCAPEISCGEKITCAADWWSLGVLSYELLTNKSFSSTHPWGIHLHSTITFPTQDISPEARSLLTGLICHNPNERLGSGINGVEEIKSHSFFKGVDWDELSVNK